MNYLNTIAKSIYNYNSFFNDVDKENIFGLLFSEIMDHVINSDISKLMVSLKKLCGEKGFIKISNYSNSFQANFYFDSEEKREAFHKSLVKRCNVFLITDNPLEFGKNSENNLFPLKLSTSESIAFLGLDPFCDETFNYGQEILIKIKQNLYHNVNEKSRASWGFYG